MWENWVIDVTLYQGDGIFCFVPVEDMGTDYPKFVVGVNLLTTIEDFKQGKIVGFIHEAGQDAVDKFVAAHPAAISAIREQQEEQHA